MKVAVTSLGETMESPVDQRFGRARYFALYDTASKQCQISDNDQNLNALQGAGIQAAQKVIELGAHKVLTGHCGPKAFAVLTAGDVDVYCGASGSVAEAIAAFEAGQLKRANGADVDGHFGSV